MASQKCPECAGEIQIPDDVLDGEILDCPGCGLELDVKLVNGAPVLKEALLEKEDWGE